MPSATASRGLPIRTSLPSSRIRPPVFFAAPKRIRAISVRPAPMRPANPRISPFRSVKLTSFTRGGPLRPSTRSISGPGSALPTRAAREPRSRPTIRLMSSSIVPVFASTSPALRPSRSTATRSVISKTSESLCEMKITEIPRCLRSRMTLNSREVSRSVSDEVGSSITSSLTLVSKALAISIICCSAVESSRTSTSRSIRTSRYSKSSTAFLRIAASSRKGERALKISRPRKRFSIAFRLGQLLSSWKMSVTPASCAWWIERNAVLFPSQRISPASARYTPARIFIRVDLPAPFSPRRPTTSPGPTEKLTSSRARTPGKDLDTCRISRRGAATSSPSLGAVQNSREHDDDPDDGGLPVRGDPHQHQAVLDDPHDASADEHAQHAPRAARERGAADHCRGNRVELPALPCVGLRGVEARHQDDPGDRGAGSGNQIKDELDPLDVDPGQEGGLFVAADGVGAAPERCGAERQVSEHGDRHRDPDGDGQPEEGALGDGQEGSGDIGDGPALGEPEHEARGEREHPERHDERRDPDIRDERAVHRSHHEPDENPKEHGKRGRDPDGHRVCGPHAREGHDRAHRQVDATGEDHEQLAQGDDCDERDLPRHQVEVAGAEEVRRGDPDHRHEEDQGEENRRFPAPHQGAGDVAAGLGISLGVHCRRSLTPAAFRPRNPRDPADTYAM